MRNLDFEKVAFLSESIRRKVENIEEFKQAKVIATYVARKDEVQTEQIIRNALASGKKIIVPLTIPIEKRIIFSELLDLSELTLGHYSLLEPRTEFLRQTPLEEADVIIVPIVAWDERGYRIGHGAGYFDKALAPIRKPMIGLAFEAQRVDKVPEETHDVPLNIIVTEDRVLRISR